jgi:AraC-like DNA-binding protein
MAFLASDDAAFFKWSEPVGRRWPPCVQRTTEVALTLRTRLTSKPMDTLSAIFSSVNVQQARTYRIEATAPWGFHSTHGSNIRFVLGLRGAAVVLTQFRSLPLSLCEWDLFILFDDSTFSFADEVNSSSVSCEALEHLKVGNTVRFGGGGAQTTLMAGHFAVDRAEAQAIFKILPTFLHLQLDQKRGRSFHSVLELLSLETERPGLASQEMINRLCEMLFIHAIRAYTSEQDHVYSGWLAGLADPQLGNTIELLHAQLQKNWTVDSLAASAGMSRSSFASRFKLIVGQSPLEYLTHWRIHRASVLMRGTDFKIAKIAKDVGYASESAFTKAFKRVMQATPSEFRGEPGQ